MSNRWLIGCSLIVFSASFAAGVIAAESASHPCAAVDGSSERLACYDAAFPRSVDAGSPAAVGTGPANGVAAHSSAESERAVGIREFGLSKDQLRKREPERMREASPDRIEAKVARIDRASGGERVVTLDNGQVWLLTEVTSKGRLRPGDQVVVRVAALSSYMLITPGKVSLRARRVR
ncbi:MAG: hypothetical protein U1A22_04460 [Xanthomonadaceae bacterium]|nr:hypothetical protein [Xanthomonadaceae bacterium]